MTSPSKPWPRQPRQVPVTALAACALIVAAASPGAAAQTPADDHAHHQHHGHQHHGAHDDHSGHGAGASGSATTLELLDLPLVDHEGNPALFRSALIGDRVVALNVMFTSCTTICPVTSAIFQQVQARLGERMGEEVYLISLSVDPARDTPQRLADYRARYDASPGWIWLTGARPDVSAVLTGLGAYTAEPENHPIMVLVGDGRSNEWSRHFGMPRPDDVVAWLDEALARRGAAE